LKVVEYITESGISPFGKWFKKLDKTTRARIASRITRFKTGNLGDVKVVGEGVFEARIFLGPGYRVYFGIDKATIVVLLLGGDKSQQSNDISKAKEYWREYGSQT
jgi:putative addiction module killer protein